MTKYRFTGDDKPPPGWRRFAEAAWLLPRLLRGFGEVEVLGPEDGPPAYVIPGFVASDKTCSYPAENPVRPDDVAATIFAALGIDPHSEMRTAADRPVAAAEGRVISEVFA